MKSRTSFVLMFVVAVLIGFNAGYLFGQSPLAPVAIFNNGTMPEGAEAAFRPFWETYNLVQARYFDQPIDPDLLAEGAINGMLDALEDPHTRYLSPQDEEAARQGMAGEIQGIGAEVSLEDEQIVIVSPIAGSPAEAAGLQPGDVILTADGVELTGLDLMEAVTYVRGPQGTAVTLEVQRGDEIFTVEVVRDVVEVASVRSELLDDNIGYVRLSQFGFRTDQELADALDELLAAQPRGLILDLRRNPGGGLETALAVADEFLDEGTVMIERFGDGFERTFETDNSGSAQEIPLVVLIDEGSASASEVLAGAIRDRERGILIGQTTYGKGTVQTWEPLSNGGGVRLTVARWLTPDEVWVNEEGLEPDYFIPLPEVASPADAQEFEDTQLQAAVDYLLGKEITSVPPQQGEG